jgi:bacillolysin
VNRKEIDQEFIMAGPFLNLRFNAMEKSQAEMAGVSERPQPFRGVGVEKSSPTAAFDNDEAAARHYCESLFRRDNRATVRGLTAPDRAEVVPDLRVKKNEPQKLTNTRLVQFQQTHSQVPVFGSNVVVEMDKDRKLISVNADLAEVQNVSPLASVTENAALGSIAKLANVSPETLKVDAVEKVFFHDEKDDRWHLAWFFKKVGAAPKDFITSKTCGHGLGRSPRDFAPVMNYVVDAHDGTVLFYFSAAPMADVTQCQGLDEGRTAQNFYGRMLPDNGGFEMSDGWRAIKTYDLQGKDIGTAFPTNPCQNATANWQDSNVAAVSAHVNAKKVYDFYKSVLMRDGVDDRGMDLISVVNCIYERDQPGPEWKNAVWFDNKMWYGQVKDGNGGFRSFSRYLDVIAHELTHGVTEHTANLVYRDQAGALNESFSDIFGIIIFNWDPTQPNADVSRWKWEIGSGLGKAGLPLRDMSDPKRTEDPAHMDNYLNTMDDNGGVHTNSNIHNKAAFNVLTARDATGKYIFKPLDVAILYYLCLQRLNSLATFSKTLQVLTDVAGVYYGGDAADRDLKVEAIRSAYKRVGIV